MKVIIEWWEKYLRGQLFMDELQYFQHISRVLFLSSTQLFFTCMWSAKWTCKCVGVWTSAWMVWPISYVPTGLGKAPIPFELIRSMHKYRFGICHFISKRTCALQKTSYPVTHVIYFVVRYSHILIILYLICILYSYIFFFIFTSNCTNW